MLIYLDNNASTSIAPRVASKVHEVMIGICGNPSSPHFAGEKARLIVEDARYAVRELVGSSSHEVFFTGSGSEANTLVISTLLKRIPAHSNTMCSLIEHSSVLRSFDIYGSNTKLHALPLNLDGTVNLNEFRDKILQLKCKFVSLQWVNNETGVVQPIDEICNICSRNGVLLHCDASQAIGKIPIQLKAEVTFLTGTGHKFHGPQGCGFLLVHPSGPEIIPIIGGGEQESGVRPGTENVAGLAGLAEAARLRRANIESDIKMMKSLRDLFESLVMEQIPQARINFSGSERVCNTSSVTFLGCDGQALMHRLSDAGVACSQSSACESNSPRPSHVLKALGFSDADAFATLRFSVSPFNTSIEIEESVRVLAEIVTQQVRFFSLERDDGFESFKGAQA
jgi:cysteine desulfurase